MNTSDHRSDGTRSLLRVGSDPHASRLAVAFAIIIFGALVVPARMMADSPDDSLEFTGGGIEFFEREVRPILAEHCYSCHSSRSEKLQAGLSVDSRAGLLKGGDSGPSMVPGDARASLLIEAVRYESYEMPPKGKLSDDQIDVLERWVAMGSPWPVEKPTPNGSAEENDPTAEVSRPVFDLQRTGK